MVIRPRNIGHGREEDGLGGVPLRDGIGILCRQRRVPEIEQILNLLLGNRLGHGTLRHDGGVVLGDLPFTILEDIHERVSSLDLGTGGAHGKFVDARILSPVGTDDNVAAFNLWMVHTSHAEVI